MRYRRKPVEVDAFQWVFTSNTATEYRDSKHFPAWAEQLVRNGMLQIIDDHGSIFLAVCTKLGAFYAKYGDWIIREADGSITSLSDQTFREHYDEVVP